MDFLISNAYAQGASAAGDQGLFSLAFPILLLVLLYFILIRPQQKQAKEHRNLVSSLKKGDEVVVSGGILGKLTEVSENYVTVSVADNVELKVQRNSIATVLPKGSIKNIT